MWYATVEMMPPFDHVYLGVMTVEVELLKDLQARIPEVKDVATTRVREGDEVMTVLGGSTKELLVFFSTAGSAYVCRLLDVPATTGYGEPVQKLFKLDDGEQVVSALSLDPRVKPPAEAQLVAVTKSGMAVRFGLAAHSEVSTRSGRLFMKVQAGDGVLGVRPALDDGRVTVATVAGRHLTCLAKDVPTLSGPGKGVHFIKLQGDDRVLGFAAGELLKVETDKGATLELGDASDVSARGGKGREAPRRAKFAKIIPPPPTVPQLGAGKSGGSGGSGGGPAGGGGGSGVGASTGAGAVGGASGYSAGSADGDFGPLFDTRS